MAASLPFVNDLARARPGAAAVAAALLVLLPAQARADDYADIDRLCRPGASDLSALAARFDAAGWGSGRAHAEDASLALAMITPLTGDTDSAIAAGAADAANAGLPEARRKIAEWPLLLGPGGAVVSIQPSPWEEPGVGATCMVVFPAAVGPGDLALRLANRFGPNDLPSMRMTGTNVEGLAGGAILFEPDLSAHGPAFAGYAGGAILHVSVRERS